MNGPRVAEWLQKHAAEHAEDWEALLKQPWGRRLLFEIADSVEYCGAQRSPYEAARKPDGSVDANEVLYLMGMQDAGKKLLLHAQAENPEMYARMIAEAMNARRMLIIAQKADAEAAAAAP